MEIKLIRSFVAVARTLSFSQAARNLHLSQPALSAQIKLLEEQLGVQLFQRNRRTVKLTAAGQALQSDAEGLLQQVSEIAVRVARVAAGDVGHLRIGFVASATLEIVPAITLAFRKQYPQVSLDLKNMPTSQQVEALRSGAIDAGFVRMPLTVDGLTVDAVHREPFALVISKTHPLARERDLSLKDLAMESFIAYGRRWAPEFYDRWTGICRRAGFIPNVIQEVAEMDTALALVAAGLGVSILPEGITRRGRLAVKVKVLSKEKVQSEIGIATRVDQQGSLVQHLVGIARHFEKR